MNKQPEVRAHTRQKLINAFWSLCEEKSLSQISVGELTRLAGYNRSTFYEYFTDMPDLIHELEDDLLSQIGQNVADNVPKKGQRDLTQNFTTFYQVFRQINEPMYYLMGPNGDPSFITRVKQVVIPILADTMEIPMDSPYFDYIAAYAYSAIIGFMQYWHDQDMSMPEEEFFQLEYQLVINGIGGVLEKVQPVEQNLASAPPQKEKEETL